MHRVRCELQLLGVEQGFSMLSQEGCRKNEKGIDAGEYAGHGS